MFYKNKINNYLNKYLYPYITSISYDYKQYLPRVKICDINSSIF